jgi:hypothetical protein
MREGNKPASNKFAGTKWELGAGVRDKAGREEACKEQMCGNQVFKEQVSEIKCAENKRIPQPEMGDKGRCQSSISFWQASLGKKVWDLTKITVGTSMQGTSV